MAGDPIKLSNLPTEMTVPPAGDDLLVVVDTSAAETKKIKNSTLMQAVTGPSGFMINGKLSVTVASNNLTVAVKTLAGTDPTAADPVYVRIGDTVRVIVAALSVTAAAATNWCNAGSAELATKEIDYFVYLGYNATDGVVIGFSRIPYATQYSDWSATATAETYAKISTITNAAAGDYYENVGRFAATLSAGAGYTWTVPTFTASNLVNHPIYETRWLNYTATPTNLTIGSGTIISKYRIVRTATKLYINAILAADSSISGDVSFSLPFAAAITPVFPATFTDTGAGGYYGYSVMTSSVVYTRVANASGTYLRGTALSATIPFTWGNTDIIKTYGEYPIVLL